MNIIPQELIGQKEKLNDLIKIYLTSNAFLNSEKWHKNMPIIYNIPSCLFDDGSNGDVILRVGLVIVALRERVGGWAGVRRPSKPF